MEKQFSTDNISTKLINQRGEVVIPYQTGQKRKKITNNQISKKGNLQLCQNYRTISNQPHK